MTIKQILQKYYSQKLALEQTEIDLLLALALHKKIEYLYKNPEKELAISTKKAFQKLIRLRLANWPIAYLQKKKDFFNLNQTTLEKELARYDLVIHLDSADGRSYDYSNQLRIESAAQAREINERIKLIWKNHPRRLIIPASDSFSQKVIKALECVEDFIENLSL